jgi:polyisoprenoid-binding protein YceI
MMISTVKGRFASFGGTVAFDARNPAATTVDVSIDVASIDTRQEQRDGHLRSPDFFDAATWPTIRFVSRRVEQAGTDDYRLIGDLTIRGVTKEVALDVAAEGTGKNPWGQEVVAFSARGKIDRTDFGLTWNQALETGGFLVSNEIRISIDLELSRPAA